MTDIKPLAVVTGASSGIGFELARQFAEHGYDLLINAEDAGLTDAAERLRADGASVQTVQADLTSYEGVEQLYAGISATGQPVSAAALNAGVGQGGRSWTSSWPTNWRSSRSTSRRRCTWPSACSGTWPPVTRAGC